MRINSVAAAVGAALLAQGAYAEDTKEETASSVAPQAPTFTPSSIKGDFVEQFTDDWEERWKPSHAKKDTKGSEKEEEEWAYVGEWSVEEPSVYKGIEGDKGLVVKNKAAHHAISAKFPTQVDNTGKTLVVQYEVKLQNGLECGGAYLKLLRDTEALHQDEFANTTPYVIMFGPDKCGHTNKVHFIFNHKNPKTGEYEEKHLNSPPSAKIVKTTELYTLVVHPNNTYAIQQNGETVKEGSLLEDFTPAVNPAEEIDDAEDKKPEDWVDQARIADPEATKPEDWDEEAPFEIVDEEATIPEDWLETEPLSVPDPEAQKPEDWDDEEDGDWIPPTVANPKCAEVSGCGPWIQPKKKNPEYKGKWNAPLIDNPAYKGVWAPRKIKNPDYFEDKTPSNFEPIGAIGFEIWTMQNDILFDNIYIGHSVEDARKFAEETYFQKITVEKAVEQAEKPKAEDKPKSLADLKFTEDPVTYVKEKIDLFMTIAAKNPVDAIKFVPEVPAALGAILVLLIGGIVALSIGGKPAPAPKKKVETESKGKDKAEASTTGADASKEGVTKRTTRSQS
ncbi:calnexin precursor [Grosmannia clavigera kw1407]|uniref:Calnexin n=1 Tax=Grosmannia clavigera (strain kw1407 / UAMH 11150) TaxID=655863 RepID=F0X9H0_GROCL|nr:calnexin precursor [Grosmannia clavigera kw1407]EFX05243.1 calnexin precursor [Grosmannia clavigera kw1407]